PRNRKLRVSFRPQPEPTPATCLQDIVDVRALGCHPLKGERKGEFSVEVNGNWRVVFKVEEPNVLDVDLEDYH
ncbi:type II toxin-antitoxin system RelE/ParE family toxin, partial [Enterobacter asburiae]|uniref:type II toxin-antitoxin system RelE/ParE family toxin n=1 Tax=Enterobacter asburiae TaxID=61645 RepID=UPI00191112D2